MVKMHRTAHFSQGSFLGYLMGTESTEIFESDQIRVKEFNFDAEIQLQSKFDFLKVTSFQQQAAACIGDSDLTTLSTSVV